MKKKNTVEEDDLLHEYDFDQLPIVKRGPGHQNRENVVRMTRVTLDSDVAEIFPDDEAVNQALRTLMRLRQTESKSAPVA